MSALRILHVVFSSRVAGSERYCVDLANRQAALGYEVHVAGASSSPVAGALAAGVRFYGYPLPVFRGAFVRRLAARLEVDVCHGHLSAACKALGTLREGPATVATLHVGYKPHQHARLGGVICVNHAQAKRLGGYGGRARTISNWLPAMDAAVAPRSLRGALGVGEKTFLVGAVGRLHPSKGLDVLIAAFRAAAPARAALAILGEGPQRGELERLAGGDPRVYFLGYRSDVQACLREVDLFVSPSREESFGLAILEAMGAGAPIVATAAEGPREYLLDQPVELVRPGEVEPLAAAIRAAAGHFARGALPRMRYDLSAFDPAAGIAAVGEFYTEVMASAAVRSRPVAARPVTVGT